MGDAGSSAHGSGTVVPPNAYRREKGFMRIAIDARLGYYIQGGIPQYTLNLINALASIDRE